jgi:hypothetical protein
MKVLIDTTKTRSTVINGEVAYFIDNPVEFTGETNENPGNNKEYYNQHRERYLQKYKADYRHNEKKLAQAKKYREECIARNGGVFAKPVFTATGVKEKLGSPEQVMQRALRGQIKGIIERYARAEIERKGLTPEEVEASGRLEHRNAYKALYSEFDRQMRIELGIQGLTLEDLGLGVSKNTTGKPYLDRIATAGYLENLQLVARELFGEK